MGGDERDVVEGILDGINHPLRVFLDRRDISSDAAENGRPCFGSKAARDFLFDFNHAEISFGLIIVKGHAEVVHKGEDFAFVLAESIQEILGWRLFGPSTLLFDAGLLPGWGIGLQSLLQDLVVSFLKGVYFSGT